MIMSNLSCQNLGLAGIKGGARSRRTRTTTPGPGEVQFKQDPDCFSAASPPTTADPVLLDEFLDAFSVRKPSLDFGGLSIRPRHFQGCRFHPGFMATDG
jgi:hypothetical protein